MARTGASFSNGSGDYAIAFSTAPGLRIHLGGGPLCGGPVLTNAAMTPLFVAVAEATAAAIVDSLCAAVQTTGNGAVVPALPVEAVKTRLAR
jgi:D-aminopeptidase